MYVFYVAPTFLSYSAIPFLFLELDSGNVAEYISQWYFSTSWTWHVFQFACLPLSKEAVVKNTFVYVML